MPEANVAGIGAQGDTLWRSQNLYWGSGSANNNYGGMANPGYTKDFIRATPFFTNKVFSIDRLFFKTAGANALGVARIGLYQDTGAGYPGAALFRSDEIADVTTETEYSATLDVALSPGWYWIVSLFGVTASHSLYGAGDNVGSAPAGLGMMGIGTAWSDGGMNFWSKANAYAALPASFPSGATQISHYPHVWFRVK